MIYIQTVLNCLGLIVIPEDQLTAAVKSRRAHEAQAQARRMHADFLVSCVGQTLPVTNAMRARHGLVFPALLLLWTDWRLFLIALIVFLAVYIATKRISVSTLAAAVCFIIFSLVLGTWLWGVKLILAVLAAAALVLPYWGNLRRYFSGLKKKKSEDEEVN